ncbi:MAG: GNAT family N-acetyltransferase, partial [Acidobacteria bacterium]|nr:GNAT family N-acetyltransferase [Acidobacteriota bacterium]
GGRLVDRKITWTCDLAALEREAGAAAVVQPYAPWMPAAALEDLAVQSAAFSRFRVDPHMPAWAADALYRTWMRRALAADLADIVLVACEATGIAGVVTVGGVGEDAAIGLLAVDAAARGRGHGQALVDAARRWAHHAHKPTLRVVTQAANLPACRLYERCGFRVATIECFYHFWLRPSLASRSA